jgi:hypothetical protein
VVGCQKSPCTPEIGVLNDEVIAVEYLVLNIVLSSCIRFNGYDNEFDWQFEHAWLRPCLNWQTESLDGRRS